MRIALSEANVFQVQLNNILIKCETGLTNSHGIINKTDCLVYYFYKTRRTQIKIFQYSILNFECWFLIKETELVYPWSSHLIHHKGRSCTFMAFTSESSPVHRWKGCLLRAVPFNKLGAEIGRENSKLFPRLYAQVAAFGREHQHVAASRQVSRARHTKSLF